MAPHIPADFFLLLLLPLLAAPHIPPLDPFMSEPPIAVPLSLLHLPAHLPAHLAVPLALEPHLLVLMLVLSALAVGA